MNYNFPFTRAWPALSVTRITFIKRSPHAARNSLISLVER